MIDNFNSLRANAKVLLKRGYYSLANPKLSRNTNFRLGYIFHTELIFDRAYFKNLLLFCDRYRELTGKKPICTIMTAVNPLVAHGMAKAGVSGKEYIDRVSELSERALIGYHGHFWFDRASFDTICGQIRCNNFNRPAFDDQFEGDLRWFAESKIDHHGFYSAGWWFMNAYVQRKLIERGFRFDFSLCRSFWFRNEYSWRLMEEHAMVTGEPLRVTSEQGSLMCVQNLIGCHTTPLVEDFVRNINQMLTPGIERVTAVVHSHDYDLDFKNTVKCIEYLLKTSNVEFWGPEDLDVLIGQHQLKTAALAPLGTEVYNDSL